MRAVTQETYGSADVLRVEEVSRPAVGDDQVLIEVFAAGLDRGVWHLTTGTPYLVRLLFGLTKPKTATPGLDVAGRVVEVGDSVTRFAPGDDVFGIASGSFAEFATAEEAKLVHKPDDVTFEQAAVATVSGITALQALTTVGSIEAGQRVLVIGASGGVGSYAVQLAKALGATVTGVASTGNVEFVRSLGADAVVDYKKEDFVDLPERFDLIVDIGGRNSVARLRSVLLPAGTLVIVGGEGGGRITGGMGRQIGAVATSVFTKQRLTFFVSEESLEFIEPLAGYIAGGEVTPAIGQRFDLDQVPEAIRQMEAGMLSGKTAIIVNSEAAGKS